MTFSHALITAALGKKGEVRDKSFLAFVVGAVVPDLSLLTLTGVSMLSSDSWAMGMEKLHHTYESSAFWIAAHNTFHSLVILGVLSLVGASFRFKRWAKWLLWCAAGAALHSVIDIFTHAGDGPQFLFPLTDYVFNSPVSYWDPAHYGRAFSVFEYTFDAMLLVFLVFGRRFKHFGRTQL